jgi:hypothetical protein
MTNHDKDGSLQTSRRGFLRSTLIAGSSAALSGTALAGRQNGGNPANQPPNVAEDAHAGRRRCRAQIRQAVEA